MIAMLRGKVAAAGLGEMVVDVAGVGYRVFVPPGSVVAPTGADVVLHTYLAVREDALTLYGFADAPTRGMFETLLSVTGVGPKLALAAIGTLGADGLRRAVVSEDVAALTVVPGIGKKGAQRMILELREKLGAMAATDGMPGHADGGAMGTRNEVREALAALGYAAAEVQATMDTLADDEQAPPEQLLRKALRALGSR